MIAQYLPTPIEQLVAQIFATRRITRADQRRFMTTVLASGSLSEQEQKLVDRVFEALQKGLLRAVD